MAENKVLAMDVAVARITLERIRQLHTPTPVCRGCCSTACVGDCDWAEEYGGEILTVCRHCCIDPFYDKQNEPCLDDHLHGAEHGDARAICATNAILGVQPPDPAVNRDGPPMAIRRTLRPL